MQDFASSVHPTGLASSSAVLVGFALLVAVYSFVEIIRGRVSPSRNPGEFVLPLLSSHQGGPGQYGTVGGGVFADTELSYEQLLALGDVIGSVKTGLAPSEIEAVSTLATHSTARAGTVRSAESCSICLEKFLEGDSVLLLACNCLPFHADCISTWLQVKPSCPCCRFSFL